MKQAQFEKEALKEFTIDYVKSAIAITFQVFKKTYHHFRDVEEKIILKS